MMRRVNDHRMRFQKITHAGSLLTDRVLLSRLNKRDIVLFLNGKAVAVFLKH